MRKMKDSGIEWIGEIPEDWVELRARYLGEFSSSGIDKKIEEGQKLVKIINYTDVFSNKKNILVSKDYMVVSAKDSQIQNSLVNKGDLIVTPSSETIEDIGISAVVDEEMENTAFSYHVLRFKFKKEIYHEYKKYLFNNHLVYNYFSSVATGTIRQTLSRDDFKNLRLIIPTKEAQENIAKHLDKKCGEIEELISIKQEKIDKLEEYKKSLIYECVTGKREV